MANTNVNQNFDSEDEANSFSKAIGGSSTVIAKPDGTFDVTPSFETPSDGAGGGSGTGTGANSAAPGGGTSEVPSVSQGSAAPTVGTPTLHETATVTANQPASPAQPAIDNGASAPTVSVSTSSSNNSVATTYTNSPVPLSYTPTAMIYSDGNALGPPLKFEASLNNNYQADKFYVKLDLALCPQGFQEAYFASGTQKQIEIWAGYDTQAPTQLLIGCIDDGDIDWFDRTYEMHGRDLSGQLMDNKTSQKYPNMTSSQIVGIIAAKYNLALDVTTTTTLVGSFYQREHAQLASEISEHDLLTYLAQQEGFNYYVKLNTLHFKAADPPDNNRFAVAYVQPTPAMIASGNFIKLTTSRSETLAKDVVVQVNSWYKKKKLLVTSKTTRTKASGSLTKQTVLGATTPQTYTFNVTGLDKEQATAYAQRMAAEISSHERNIAVEMPVDFALTPRQQIVLFGTNTEYDQSYYVDAIELEGSVEGFSMVIHAKNHSPQTQVSV